PSTSQDPVTRKENANNFVDLYNNITHVETQNEIINQEVITTYYLFGKVLEEKLQLPNSVSDNLLRKKKERAQKIYELFTKIGVDKI
ncbi:44270_t:CDS:2, partial [Gigaspora margarita]